jgi:hypothetical protein
MLSVNRLRSKALLYFLSLTAGCGGTLGGNPELAGLRFSITDAPVDDARSVFIKISSIAVKQEAGDWLEIPLTATEEIDLLALQHGRAKAFAALQELSAGTYTETRLVLASDAPGRLIDKDGVEHPLKIPSGSSSGLKIKSSFTVTAGVFQDMTIDFDLRKSLKLTGHGNSDNGKYMMSPVLRLADNRAVGSIRGIGANDAIACAYPASISTYESECAEAVTTAKVVQGRFILSYLMPGEYNVVLFQGTAKIAEKAQVAVRAREEADIGLLP